MLKPGDTFERYTIEAPLGQGGMGSVYRAHDTRLGRRVALKVISEGRREEAEADARLVREARAAAALDHPNAVSIFDVGEHEGAPYIVMELVEGRTLRSAVGDAPVPVSTHVAQLADVARALAAAHRRGLVHRDVKPENVMVRSDGVVKVLDFGIARRAGGGADPHADTQTPALPTLTVEGVKLGTPVYMAPEQIRGDALDGRTDQFAWGVVAYEMLTGRLPWRGSSDAMAVMASVLTDRPDPAPLERAGVPRPVQDVVLRALEKRPDARFPSMDDVARALDAARTGEDPAPPEPREARAPEGATEAQSFSTDEVREVLSRAIDAQARSGTTKLRFEDLLAVAAEVGVDPESLREASRALRASKDPERALEKAPEAPVGVDVARRDSWLRQQRMLFFRHAGVYAIVNAALWVLGLVILPSMLPPTAWPSMHWWVWFLPALAWGVGLAIHGLVAMTYGEEDWREHQDGMRWWNEHQQRRHEERMARRARWQQPRQDVRAPPMEEPRARARVEAGRRVRVDAPVSMGPQAAPNPGPAGRAQVPTDTGRERQAEEEAAEAEGRRGRRRRER